MRKILFVTMAFLAVSVAAKPAAVPFQRIVSVSENGSMVSLRMEDGKTVEVAPSKLMIQKNGTVAQLSSMSNSGSLRAVARVRYRPDGSVARVRVRLFNSDAEARAFLQKAANRQSDH